MVTPNVDTDSNVGGYDYDDNDNDFIRTISDDEDVKSGSVVDVGVGDKGRKHGLQRSEKGKGNTKSENGNGNGNKRKRGMIDGIDGEGGGSSEKGRHMQNYRAEQRKRVKGRHHNGDGYDGENIVGMKVRREEITLNGRGTGRQGHSSRGDSREGDIDEDGDGNNDNEGNEDVEDDEDVVMTSDFEFAVDDMLDGDMSDDFDGWGVGARVMDRGREREHGDGEKKGVDVDEIIARRRMGRKSGREGGGANGHVVDSGSGREEEDGDAGDNKGSKADKRETKMDGTTGGIEDETFLGFEDDEADEYLADDAFGMNVSGMEEDEDEGEDEGDGTSTSEGGSISSDDSESIAKPVPHPYDDEGTSSDANDDDEDTESKEDPEEAERKAAFFAAESDYNKIGQSMKSNETGLSFTSMSLSRPIMKGLSAVGFSEPTPIQSKTIPIALLGKDVVGGAVTGSGKTAAFVIPILERLLYRPKKLPTTRVAILMPTRELAVQCFNVARKLASFTDITFAQIVGGFSLREQESVLKKRPDVIIATPGRFIDHMRNSPSFAVDAIEILVLDEADRMLEDGFADELNEILTTIPKSRQTLLFSATMTDSIDRLVRVGLNRPVRLLVDAKKQTVSGLVQEFVRLRQGREDKRLAYLMYLCENVFTERVIIFFRQKREAHRVRVVFGLCGFKAGELHGSMTQEQRIQSIESFRSGQVSFLLATDLAARGLDIKNVNTVLNYTAPQNHEIYLHRVGRTARAGRTGRACTIAAEADRKVVKMAVRLARAQQKGTTQIQSRSIPADVADAWHARLEGLQDEVEAVLADEKAEKALASAERDVRRGENMVVHEKEIMARPRRTWFESEKEKKLARVRGRKELNGPGDMLGKKPGSTGGAGGTGGISNAIKGVEGNGDLPTGGKSKKRKLSGKEKKTLDVRDERESKRSWKKGAAQRLSKGGKSDKGVKNGGKGKGKGSRKANGRANGGNGKKLRNGNVKGKRG